MNTITFERHYLNDCHRERLIDFLWPNKDAKIRLSTDGYSDRQLRTTAFSQILHDHDADKYILIGDVLYEKVGPLKTWWELGIVEESLGESETRTIDRFQDIREALQALLKQTTGNAFLDLWHQYDGMPPYPLDGPTEISRQDLLKIFREIMP